MFLPCDNLKIAKICSVVKTKVQTFVIKYYLFASECCYSGYGDDIYVIYLHM